MKKKPLYVKYLLTDVITGIGFIGMGITKMKNTVPFAIMSIVFGVITIAAIIVGTIMGFEDDDEMSEYHRMKAKASAYDSLYGIVTGFSLVAIVKHFLGKDIISDGLIWVYILMGVMNFYTGLYFLKYERSGDTDE